MKMEKILNWRFSVCEWKKQHECFMRMETVAREYLMVWTNDLQRAGGEPVYLKRQLIIAPQTKPFFNCARLEIWLLLKIWQSSRRKLITPSNWKQNKRRFLFLENKFFDCRDGCEYLEKSFWTRFLFSECMKRNLIFRNTTLNPSIHLPPSENWRNRQISPRIKIIKLRYLSEKSRRIIKGRKKK